MKIAYVTGDIQPNGHFSFFHDLLVNYPSPEPNWFHKVYLLLPNFTPELVQFLKERAVYPQTIFKLFHRDEDAYYKKLAADIEDCDVIISGNITDLDEALPEFAIKKPIVSLSISEQGFKTPQGSYGSIYKERFHKAAVSQAAKLSFPENVRQDVEVIYSGIDPARLSAKKPRNEIRETWFPGEANDVKLILFHGVQQLSKGIVPLVESLEYLPKNYHIIIPYKGQTFPSYVVIPERFRNRVHRCSPTYQIADLYTACDYYVLPTQHEGFSMALLEAWFLEVPTVTTRHKAVLELRDNHPNVDFGQLLDLEFAPQDLANAIQEAKKSETAAQCVCQNYLATHMVQRWQVYLEKVINGYAA